MGWWLLLAALAVLYYAPALREMMRPKLTDADRAQAPGQFADLPRGRTHYQWHGPEDGPIVVCIHGLTTPSFYWADLLPHLIDGVGQ